MKILLSVLLLVLVLGAVFFTLLARFAVRPKVWELEDSKKRWMERPIMQGENFVIEQEHIVKSFDGYELYVGLLPGNPKSKHYVVLSHGYTCTHYGMYKYAMLYRRMGYHCVVYDQRGHGGNKRTVTTFGHKEARDLMAVVEDTYQRYGADIQLGLHGESMGSGTQIEALKYHPKADFIVNDCGYGDILNVLKWKCNQEFHLPGVCAEIASVFAKIVYGYSFHEVRPIENLKENTIPICFIHGGEDGFVPNWHSKKMYETTKGYKEIHIFEGADHAVCIEEDLVRYEKILKSFTEKVYGKDN